MRRMVQGDLDMPPSPTEEHCEPSGKDAAMLLQHVQNYDIDLDNDFAQRLAGRCFFETQSCAFRRECAYSDVCARHSLVHFGESVLILMCVCVCVWMTWTHVSYLFAKSQECISTFSPAAHPSLTRYPL